MQVGLVFGAGGIAGEAYHRGVVRALTEIGWDARRADVVVGTSAGSVVAASLRANRGLGPVPPPDLAPAPPVPAPLWFSGPLRSRLSARLLGRLPGGRVGTDFIRGGFDRRFGDGWPQRPTWIVAVRRRDGRRVVFGTEAAPPAPVGAAVAASCAIPMYFRPVRIGDEEYVDGGAHSPTNADVLRRCRLDLVVVSSPMSVQLTAARPTIDVGFRLRFHYLLGRELRRLRPSVRLAVPVEPDERLTHLLGLNMMHARNIDRIEELAFAHATVRLREAGADRLLRPMRAAG